MMRIESAILVAIFNSLALAKSFSSTQKPSVLIIGAGAAGISAARRLLEHGITNITILEAQDRIGGRINSVPFGEGMVDLGARWCHGQGGNVVYEMVKDLNLLGISELPTDLFYSDGRQLDEELSNSIGNMMDQLYLVDADYPEEYKNIGDYCEKNYKRMIEEKFQNDSKDFEIADAALDYFELSVLSNEGSFSWYDSAARNDYVECEGNLEQNWKGKGYKTFLNVLMQKYPDSTKELPIEKNVLFNKEVVNIIWRQEDQSKGITVKCEDNTTYIADHLIYTPSFGVLKETSGSMFIPPLPRVKQDAIKSMGFGPVLKVIMAFKQKWWTDTPNGFNFIWSKDDKMTAVKEFALGPSLEGRSWVTYNVFSFAVENNPKILVAWFTGVLVPKIECLSDEILIDGLYYTYNKFLGKKYNVTKPEKIIHSNWATNKYFRGSYSYQTENATRDNKITSANDDMAVPIKNTFGMPFLQFAGEGTHPHYFSNVHGAVESGFREGDRIINWYKTKNTGTT